MRTHREPNARLREYARKSSIVLASMVSMTTQFVAREFQRHDGRHSNSK